MVSAMIYDWSLATHVDFRIIQILIGSELMEMLYINNLEK